MTLQLAAFILDTVMVLLLAGTIYFAWKLSDQIERFRRNRSDMDRMVRDLVVTVDNAQSAIAGLRETAKSSGDNLQTVIDRATALSDELQLVTEAGDALSRRLEGLATRSGNRGEAEPRAEGRPQPEREESASPSLFAIRDREYDSAQEDEPEIGDSDDWAGVEDLRSQAEKDLYEALHKTRKRPGTLM